MYYGYVCDKIGMTKEMEQTVVIGREHVLQKNDQVVDILQLHLS